MDARLCMRTRLCRACANNDRRDEGVPARAHRQPAAAFAQRHHRHDGAHVRVPGSSWCFYLVGCNNDGESVCTGLRGASAGSGVALHLGRPVAGVSLRYERKPEHVAVGRNAHGQLSCAHWGRHVEQLDRHRQSLQRREQRVHAEPTGLLVAGTAIPVAAVSEWRGPAVPQLRARHLSGVELHGLERLPGHPARLRMASRANGFAILSWRWQPGRWLVATRRHLPRVGLLGRILPSAGLCVAACSKRHACVSRWGQSVGRHVAARCPLSIVGLHRRRVSSAACSRRVLRSDDLSRWCVQSRLRTEHRKHVQSVAVRNHDRLQRRHAESKRDEHERLHTDQHGCGNAGQNVPD